MESRLSIVDFNIGTTSLVKVLLVMKIEAHFTFSMSFRLSGLHVILLRVEFYADWRDSSAVTSTASCML